MNTMESDMNMSRQKYGSMISDWLMVHVLDDQRLEYDEWLNDVQRKKPT